MIPSFLFLSLFFVYNNVDAVDSVSNALSLHSTVCNGIIATVFVSLCAKK